MEVRELSQQCRWEEITFFLPQTLADVAGVEQGVSRVCRAALGEQHAFQASLWEAIGHVLLGLGVEHAQCDQVVDVAEHLTGLGLAAGAGGEIGEGLGGHGQAQARAAALVQQLDEGVLTTSAASSMKTFTGVRFPP
jgi:hypothetical protein